MPVDASETDDAAVEAVERALNNTNTDPRRANGTGSSRPRRRQPAAAPNGSLEVHRSDHAGSDAVNALEDALRDEPQPPGPVRNSPSNRPRLRSPDSAASGRSAAGNSAAGPSTPGKSLARPRAKGAPTNQPPVPAASRPQQRLAIQREPDQRGRDERPRKDRRSHPVEGRSAFAAPRRRPPIVTFVLAAAIGVAAILGLFIATAPDNGLLKLFGPMSEGAARSAYLVSLFVILMALIWTGSVFDPGQTSSEHLDLRSRGCWSTW